MLLYPLIQCIRHLCAIHTKIRSATLRTGSEGWWMPEQPHSLSVRQVMPLCLSALMPWLRASCSSICMRLRASRGCVPEPTVRDSAGATRCCSLNMKNKYYHYKKGTNYPNKMLRIILFQKILQFSRSVQFVFKVNRTMYIVIFQNIGYII